MHDDADPTGGDPPRIDVSPALHMAGHEAELLGLEDVEDTAPVLEGEGRGGDDHGEPRHHLGTDIATRGAGHAD